MSTSTRRAFVRYVLPVLLLGTLWLSCGTGKCPPGCCIATLSPKLLVEAPPDGGVVPDVDAFVVGVGVDAGGQLSCTPSYLATACYWPGGQSSDAGSYTIQVAAPGYQTVNVAVTLSFQTTCYGASFAVLSPNAVVLTPGDGGP